MSRVKMNKEGIFLDDKAMIVLCGSLFYYRIPSDLWEDRMIKIKAAGYNCIDVYFPWNFHESKEGEWDFSGERDVERFLKLAKKHELFIMARPGPYICGEWDGGGLPAYLYTKDISVRDNDEGYLAYVEKWYKRIIPLIAKYQVDNEGTVINLQVENELDFYKVCKDPKGYIEKLRDIAIQYGITVPVIACVGYFDIERATGFAENVIPTMNIYPDSHNEKFESYSVKFNDYMAERDYPLMVTETNRSHHMLRRLMLNGTKLLGPFNQVGGSSFGFYNAINNWGKPLSFLASDYHFGGLVNGQGEVNHEFYESRLLGNFIELFGNKIGRSQLVKKEINFLQKEDIKNYPYMLELFGGGYLTTATNYGKEEEHIKVEIDDVIYPRNCELKLERLKAPFLLYDTPLDFLGFDFKVIFSSLELSQCFKNAEETILSVYTNDIGEIQLDLNEEDVNIIECDGSYAFDQHLIINLKEKEHCKLEVRGKVLNIMAFNPKEASLIKNIQNNEVSYVRDLHIHSTDYEEEVVYAQEEISIDAFDVNKIHTNEVKHLEEYGHYTGFGCYHFDFKKDENIKGILVNEVSDVCSVYLNKSFMGTQVTCNNHQLFELDPHDLLDTNEVVVKTEIWGHTNFHDSVLPSLVMDSLKGLTGLTLVTDINTIDATVDKKENEMQLVFNTTLSENQKVFLRLGINQHCKMVLNQKEVGIFNAIHNVADITEFVKSFDNELLLKFRDELTLEKVELIIGYHANFKKVNGLDEKDVLALVDNRQVEGTKLPYTLESGKTSVLHVSINDVEDKCLYAVVEGKNLKLTAFYNDHLVSRLWINSSNGPRVVGGNNSRIYLPGPYSRKHGNKLKVLIEAIDKDEPTELTSIKYLVINH